MKTYNLNGKQVGAQKYVRGVWEKVTDHWYSVRVVVGELDKWFPGLYSRWSLGAELTEEHLEKVRHVEEEIRVIEAGISWFIDMEDNKHEPIWRRILVREQEALAKLRRGMKE